MRSVAAESPREDGEGAGGAGVHEVSAAGLHGSGGAPERDVWRDDSASSDGRFGESGGVFLADADAGDRADV